MAPRKKVWDLPLLADFADLTTKEFLAKHSDWNGSQLRNARARAGVNMTQAAQRRSRIEANAGLKLPDVGFTREQAASMTASEIAAATGLTLDQVEKRRQAQGWRGTKPDGVTVNLDRGQMIAALEADGFRVSKALPHEPIVRLAGKPGQHFKAAVVCCTHLGNVAQQITHLHDFYRYAESKGYEDFWNAGDTTDGPDSMHRDAVHEHFVHTFDSAVDYWVQAYPKPKNGKTRLILGNHDESWLKDPSGSDIGRRIAERRPDVEYIGRRAADISVGPLRVYIIHGSGASSYARSYKLQKIVEGFPVPRRPHVLLAGNWHVPAHIPGYMGTEAFMLPSFEHSTPFITSLGKGDSVIGGLLLDIELGQTGLRDIKVEWRMYDVALKGDHPK